MTSASPAPNDAVAQLRGALAGRVITRDDPDYDEARALYYGGLDRQPLAVVRPAHASDVSLVVRRAAASGVELAVRSGGHGALGHASVDGGIVLDLGDLRGLEIDVAGRTAWAGAGLTTGEYTHAVGAHGLATGFGDTGTVGIGGLTLGGGIGLLARKHGMTIDHLLATEVVTPDGQVRHVDATTDPELFWAIRGGGGNFGVATRFEFRLHEVPSIVGGFLVLPATAEVVDGFVAGAEAAPEELTALANVMSAAPPLPFLPPEVHGRQVLFAMIVFAGETEAGLAALAPFRSLATPLADLTGPMSYAGMFPPEEADFHPTAVFENLFRDTFDLDTARTVMDALDQSTAPMAAVQIRVLGGAMARVPVEATAFAHRDRRLMVNVAALYDDPDEQTMHRAWVDRWATALAQGPTGRYVNFLGDDSDAGARAAYPGATWDRLGTVKRRYDPENLFRHNVNVPPAG